MTTPPHPPTKRDDTVETLFGHAVPDPYRWLEASDQPEVKRWVEAQNTHTRAVLGAIPMRAPLARRLEELLQIGERSLPWVRRLDSGAVRLFFTRREGTQNQPALMVEDLGSGPRVLFDPNRERTDGKLSLDYFIPSREGRLLAYGTSEGGSEEATLRVLEVDAGRRLPLEISRARYASVCWLPGGKRFFYTRFPKPGSVPEGEERYHRRLYEHVIGRDPDDDPLIFAASSMTDFPSCTLSPNGRWLVIRVHQSWSRSSLFLADTRQSPLKFQKLTGDTEHVYDPLITDDTLFVRTNENSPRFALHAVDPARPERENWRQVIAAHSADVLSEFAFVGGRLFLGYLSNSASRLEQFRPTGESLGTVPLPTVGTNNGVSGLHDGDTAYFDFESVATAPIVFRLDLKSGTRAVEAQVTAPFGADAFIATTHTATSRDGTQVPYLVVRRRDIQLSAGPHRTLLYAYGGFNVSLQPRFSRTLAAWIEKGGIYAQANLRGGGEKGQAWHDAGRREKKQNVFDDFYAVSEKLIADRVASRETLGIYGRSNGGLLIAAAVTQRPDLFRAAVSSVPLTDMLRFDRFLIAKLWTAEYGSPDKQPDFDWLRAYSPYHNVKPGTPYPAVLITSAESDTRVHPAHAMKMGAALQYASSSGLPVLVRIDADAGHGQGKPTALVAEEHADIYAFLWSQLTDPGAPSGRGD